MASNRTTTSQSILYETLASTAYRSPASHSTSRLSVSTTSSSSSAASPSVQPSMMVLQNVPSCVAGGGERRRQPQAPAKSHFPAQLHIMLYDAERVGFSQIVCWKSHGRAFQIKDRDLFMAKIVPLYFKQTRFGSFQRQLNLYGFLRAKRKGKDHGAYYHELFLRGRYGPTLAIKRVKSLDEHAKARVEDPDFYSLEPCFDTLDETAQAVQQIIHPSCNGDSERRNTNNSACQSKSNSNKNNEDAIPSHLQVCKTPPKPLRDHQQQSCEILGQATLVSSSSNYFFKESDLSSIFLPQRPTAGPEETVQQPLSSLLSSSWMSRSQCSFIGTETKTSRYQIGAQDETDHSNNSNYNETSIILRQERQQVNRHNQNKEQGSDDGRMVQWDSFRKFYYREQHNACRSIGHTTTQERKQERHGKNLALGISFCDSEINSCSEKENDDDRSVGTIAIADIADCATLFQDIDFTF